MICGAMLLLFILQNMTIVEINFLFWSFQTSRFVIIAFSLLTGILIGMIISSHKKTDTEIETTE
ncbi:MAG: LapA family protein [Kordiimonadaceae bacterium]|nr:LapA family protein [Kordiimonadaceae bacterium]